MKKFLALLLSVLMLLSMTVVFAEGGDVNEGGEGNGTTDTTTTLSNVFTKKYTGAAPVGDVLNFKVEFVKELLTGVEGADKDPNAAPLVTVEPHTVKTSEDKVTFNYAKPDAYGSYIYKITEVAPEAPGYVTYDTNALFVVVAYTVDENGNDVLTASLINDPAGAASNQTKADEFVNEYAVGQFDVTKKITGNAAVDTDKFVVEVSFTSEKALNNLAMTQTTNKPAEGAEATTAVAISALEANTAVITNITIGKDETITFGNVPQGVTVKVVEKKQDGMAGENDLNNYTPSYDKQEITVDGDGESITITNTKNVNIPTGVALDTVPYIVLLAVAVLGVVAFVVKRRMAAADED